MSVREALSNIFPGIGVEGATTAQPDPTAGAGQPVASGPVEGNTQPAPQGAPAAGPQPVPGSVNPSPPSPDPEPKDPLAHFSDLFDNSKLEANQPEPNIGAGDLFTNENMGKILESLPAFTDHITSETREKLAAGEDPNAVMVAFDEIGKGAYAAALQHAVRLSESLTDRRMKTLENSFSERINQHQVQQSINQHEAIKDSPVLQAGISIIAERLQKTNPTASAEWITDQSTKFFLDSANLLTGNKSGGQGQPGGGQNPAEAETDWVAFALNQAGVNPPDSSGEAQ